MQTSFGILKIFPSLLVNLKTFRSNSRLSNVDFKWDKKRTCSIFFSLQRFLARVAKTGASSSKVPELNRILVFHLKLLLKTGKKRSHLFTFERKKPVMVASFSLGFSSFEAVSSCLELKRLKNDVPHPIFQSFLSSESFSLNHSDLICSLIFFLSPSKSSLFGGWSRSQTGGLDRRNFIGSRKWFIVPGPDKSLMHLALDGVGVEPGETHLRYLDQIRTRAAHEIEKNVSAAASNRVRCLLFSEPGLPSQASNSLK